MVCKLLPFCSMKVRDFHTSVINVSLEIIPEYGSSSQLTRLVCEMHTQNGFFFYTNVALDLLSRHVKTCICWGGNPD